MTLQEEIFMKGKIITSTDSLKQLMYRQVNCASSCTSFSSSSSLSSLYFLLHTHFLSCTSPRLDIQMIILVVIELLYPLLLCECELNVMITKDSNRTDT